MRDAQPSAVPGLVVFLLYMAAVLGVVGAIAAATMSGDGALRFVLAAICIMLSTLCIGIGVGLDVQRPS